MALRNLSLAAGLDRNRHGCAGSLDRIDPSGRMIVRYRGPGLGPSVGFLRLLQLTPRWTLNCLELHVSGAAVHKFQTSTQEVRE